MSPTPLPGDTVAAQEGAGAKAGTTSKKDDGDDGNVGLLYTAGAMFAAGMLAIVGGAACMVLCRIRYQRLKTDEDTVGEEDSGTVLEMGSFSPRDRLSSRR